MSSSLSATMMVAAAELRAGIDAALVATAEGTTTLGVDTIRLRLREGDELVEVVFAPTERASRDLPDGGGIAGGPPRARLVAHLRARSVADLAGVDAATAARLEQAGLHTVGLIAAASPIDLVRRLGPRVAAIGARARQLLALSAVPAAAGRDARCTDVLRSAASDNPPPASVVAAVVHLASLLDDRVLAELSVADLVAST